MLHYKIVLPQKSLPRQAIYRQKSAPPAGKLSARRDVFFWGGVDPIRGRLFWWADDIIIKGRHINSVIISPRADFLHGGHFNVTPAPGVRGRFSFGTHERSASRPSRSDRHTIHAAERCLNARRQTDSWTDGRAIV